MPRWKSSVVCVLIMAASAPSAPAPQPKANTGPIRVLLVAAAATREYQFVRNLMLHEATAGRAVVAVALQTPFGRDTPREGVDQGATLLTKFPDNPADYDVIVAFDPDWGQLNDDRQKALGAWVGRGGGLVLIAGPVNTGALSSKTNADKYRPVLDLYPVVLRDSPAAPANGESDMAFALNFPGDEKATPAFLKLDPAGKGPLAGWHEFFYGDGEQHKESPERGFYQTYPVDSLKPTATVLATLADPKAKLADASEAPFLVAMARGEGRVVFLGSGEMWRLRQYREAFHERFWTELIRYSRATPAKEEPEKAKPSPDDLSLEVQALRLLYAFDFTPDQRQDLEKRAKETMQPARKHKATKVSKAYLHALTELRDALADASDDDAIDEKEDAVAEIEDKEAPDLDDDVELTPAARKQAVEVLRGLQPAQLKTYGEREQDDAVEPQEELLKALVEVRDLKSDDWKDRRDEIAEDAAAAMVGADADKGAKVRDRVTALLDKARGLTADEFKTQKADLQKAAQEIAGTIGPDEVLKNRAEYDLAELLSNSQLGEALKARSK